MSKMIQVRNVPDQLHRRLKIKAAERGMTLSDYLVAELRLIAERLSPQELAARARVITREDFDPPVAELIRADRDSH